MIIQAILNGCKINVQCEEFHVLLFYVLFRFLFYFTRHCIISHFIIIIFFL